MLLDKGYFDYDFEKVDAPEIVGNWEDTIKSEEEVDSILSIFGLSSNRTKTTEEIQAHIINQIKED